MKPKIGVMQGRLSPAVGGRLQAYPSQSWQQEFIDAASIGIDSIEWIIESPLEQNAALDPDRMIGIKKIVADTKVNIEFLIADYFIESPLVRMSSITRVENQKILSKILFCASEIGARGVELPFVDASAIFSMQDEDELATAIEPALKQAELLGLEIGLETSLPPDRFRALLERIGHPKLRANYDIGNSAALGFDADEELSAYGGWINNVHIKDRLLGGGSVALGEGAAKYPDIFRLFLKYNYEGNYVLQAARGGNEKEVVKKYLSQVRNWMLE
jgi:L-ribulose-5-phosphate 3-epimerase